MELLTVTAGHIKEIKSLVETGDVDLAERREVYLDRAGKTCPLDAEKLVIAVAATTDDDDEEFVKNVDIVASGKYVIQ